MKETLSESKMENKSVWTLGEPSSKTTYDI